jgi:hypothetical protein
MSFIGQDLRLLGRGRKGAASSKAKPVDRINIWFLWTKARAPIVAVKEVVTISSS